jgi:hypothetical protein
LESKEYARDKIDASKWQKWYAGKEGADKFWRRNARLQAFIDENYKTSSADNRSDSETSCK